MNGLVTHPSRRYIDTTMMTPSKIRFIASSSTVLVGLLAALVAGCGSSGSQPAATADDVDASSEEAARTAEEEEDTGSDESAPEEPAEPEGPNLSRPVADIISEPDNAWVYNFQGSEPYDKAQEKCDERFKDKPQERARCMSSARSSFVADAMEFKKNASGQLVWVVYRTQGSRLHQVYSVPVAFGEEAAGVLKVQKTGNGKGTPPLFGSAREFEVKLLSNYVMELQDPRHGRLTYDARIGFVSR